VQYLLLLLFLGAPVAAQDRPVLRAAPLTGTIRLDGRLDEAAWSTADSITTLTQVEPPEGWRPARGTRTTLWPLRSDRFHDPCWPRKAPLARRVGRADPGREKVRPSEAVCAPSA